MNGSVWLKWAVRAVVAATVVVSLFVLAIVLAVMSGGLDITFG